MKQISFYQTIDSLLEKTVCLIVEKCYLSNFRVIIVTANSEMQELINKALWTYSQKQFIPHGSKIDPMPEIQPVYITDTIESVNNANTLILVNKALPTLSSLLFDRIFSIYTTSNEEVYNSIENTIKELKSLNLKVDWHKQTLKGKWE